MAFVEDTKDWSFSFAPGRIEFLGNHLDYNGGDVLGMAVNAGIYCLGVPDSENNTHENTKGKNRFSLFSECFEDAAWEGQLDNIKRQDGKFAWTNYCLGVLKELQARVAPAKVCLIFRHPKIWTIKCHSVLVLTILGGGKVTNEELAVCRSENHLSDSLWNNDQNLSIWRKRSPRAYRLQ